MSFGGFLRQSTAVTLYIGPFVDSIDGDTEETGLTISQADVRLSKNGGASAQKNDSNAAAHDADGMYTVALNTTDTNTVGILTVYVHESGALFFRKDYQILEEAVYDILFAASATGAVPVASIANNAITAAAIATGAIDADAIADNAIDAGAIASDAITAAKLASDVATEINAAVLAVLGALNDAAVDGDPTTTDTLMQYVKQIVNTLVGTAGIPTFPASATPANAVSLAEVIRQIYDEVAGVNGATPLDAAGVRSALGMASANMDTQLSGIQSDTNDIQTRLPAALVSGRMDASVGAMAADVMTAAATAADYVTELQAGLATAVAVQAVDDLVDDLESRVGVPTDFGSGATLADNNEDIGGIVNAIKAKTDNLPSDPADASVVAGLIDALPTAAENADFLLKLDLSTVTGEAARSVLNALRFSRNRWQISGGVLTVYEEDDTTVAWTGAVTTAAGNPVTQVDPA